MKAQKLTRETILNIGVTDRKFPNFRIGDTVRVSQFVKEGEKERLQVFEGDVIADHRKGVGSTFTVRRIGANNIGVERIYPFYSPIINDITIVRRGKIRRAKLYYVRKLIGKAAKLKELVISRHSKKKAATKKVTKTQTPQKTKVD